MNSQPFVTILIKMFQRLQKMNCFTNGFRPMPFAYIWRCDDCVLPVHAARRLAAGFVCLRLLCSFAVNEDRFVVRPGRSDRIEVSRRTLSRWVADSGNLCHPAYIRFTNLP